MRVHPECGEGLQCPTCGTCGLCVEDELTVLRDVAKAALTVWRAWENDAPTRAMKALSTQLGRLDLESMLEELRASSEAE